MNSTVRAARIAGAWYLLEGIIGLFRLMYIPSALFVHGDVAATASNIASHDMIFRLAILSELLEGVLGIFVALALYRLLKTVNRNLAVLMVILGALMVTPLWFFNSLNDLAALTFARGADFLAIFDKPQRDAFVMLFLRLHDAGDAVNGIFWGLWLFPLAILVYRSRFLPRFLGVWLFINGLAYVVVSLTELLMPQYEGAVSNALFPALFGEVAFMLWLVIRGAKVQSLTGAPAVNVMP